MSLMWMSEKEIFESYRDAACPNKQIKVLAELNVCTKNEIKEILISRGIDPQKLKTKPRKTPENRVSWGVNNCLTLLFEINSGKTYSEIAKEIGCSASAIRNVYSQIRPDSVKIATSAMQEALQIFNEKQKNSGLGAENTKTASQGMQIHSSATAPLF